MDAAHAQLTLLMLGPKDSANVGITAIRRRDRLAMAGASVTLEVEIKNFGQNNSPAREVSVAIGESVVGRPVPPLAPGASAVVDIEHTFREPGFHGVTAGLKQDRYAVDDRGALALEVVGTSEVLVVNGDPGSVPEDSETFYLSPALDPGGDVLSGISPLEIPIHSLPDQDLEHVNMIFLANVAGPRPEVVEKLENFVADGGGLVMFLGEQVSPDGRQGYNQVFYKDGKGLLPLRLTERKGNVDRPDNAFVADRTHFAIKDNSGMMELVLSKLVLVGRYMRPLGSMTPWSVLRACDHRRSGAISTGSEAAPRSSPQRSTASRRSGGRRRSGGPRRCRRRARGTGTRAA